MRLESQWPGDAIAAPICDTYDREDAFFERLGDRSRNRVDSRSERAEADPIAVVLEEGRRAQTAPTGPAVSRAWIASIVSILAEVWSRMLRHNEIRRMRTGWEKIDEQTLKDIGICRGEIEYRRNARHWS
jgi:uncharacterized protein YjiS (DUF1127 family)